MSSNPQTFPHYVRWRLSGHSAVALSLFGFLGVLRACASYPVPANNSKSVAEALGRESSTAVEASDYAWERGGDDLEELYIGRPLLFLGRGSNGNRDVFRAWVLLTPGSSHPLEVEAITNLTLTPDGDEQGLVVDETGLHAAYATVGRERVQGITVLDLNGESNDAKWSLGERTMLGVSRWQETGDARGIGRYEITFSGTYTTASLSFTGSLLHLKLAGKDGQKDFTIDCNNGQLQGTAAGISVDPVQRVPKRFEHWAVDTVRAIPAIGTEPIAWLESQTWAWKDYFKRTWFKTFTAQSKTTEVKQAVEQQLLAPKPLDPKDAGEDGGYWPPKNLQTLFTSPEPGEGVWVPVDYAWMHSLPGAPHAFYRTFVRPDAERSFSKVILVAMDTRQLDFDMEAGVEDPKSTVGSFHGRGRLPNDPALAPRVVAAWNGGFKTEHGHYGMMIKKRDEHGLDLHDHRVLLPPVPHAASVVITDEGLLGLGEWGPSPEIPPNLLAYRQNMDPLVDNGLFNPRNRPSWGAVLKGQPHLSGQQTERAGICLTKAHHFYYVWGDDVGPEALGKAMQLAGCDFGMHLDMNPFHTGFVFLSFNDARYQQGQSVTLTPLMAIGPRRYIDYNPKDFFFATLREPKSPLEGSFEWQPDSVIQPAPAWFPGIFHASTNGVDLIAIEPHRVRWVARAGTKDKTDGKPDAGELSDSDQSHAIAALNFATNSNYQLVLHKQKLHVGHSDGPALVIDAQGEIKIVLGQQDLPPDADVLAGPVLLIDGKLQDVPTVQTDSKTLVAVGTTKSGALLIATGGDLQAMAKALQAAGAMRAIAAPGHEGAWLRASNETPLQSWYPLTTLYAVATPLAPRAFRWDHDDADQPKWPAWTKSVP